MKRVRVAVAALAVVGAIGVGCGDDDDDESGEQTSAASTVSVPGGAQAAALQEEIAELSDEEQIVRVGEEWANLFGNSDEAMCGYLHPDLGPGSSTCSQYIIGTLTQSDELQRSFAGGTVESVDITGDTALAEFDNGHLVEFATDPEGAWRVTETPRADISGGDEVIEPG